MRHIPLCLVVPFVLACGLFGPSEPTLRLQGTVTAADDGSPIIGARVFVFTSFTPSVPRGSGLTDALGRYAFSFETDSRGCDVEFETEVHDADTRFYSSPRSESSSIRCTDEVQTLDFQLERIILPGPTGG